MMALGNDAQVLMSCQAKKSPVSNGTIYTVMLGLAGILVQAGWDPCSQTETEGTGT